MQEQNPIVLMNFSGIYREEEFWKNRQVSWIELQDVCGTNCYCDEEAIAEINKRTENYPTAGIHFIDSGNYHYMTRLWLTRMDQPFCLLVYDNHTDMQPPAFGGILSCGGWIAAALEELENLKYVILVGPDEAAYEQVDENLKDRVIFLSREKLQVMNDEERNWFLRETVSEVCNWRKSEGLQEDAEKFDHKSSYTVENKIAGSHLSICFLMLCHIKQQQKMGKIQKTGINLCRDQSNIVGCKI